MNSLVIVLFLSGMVAMIMLRTLHKDIARYNQVDQSIEHPVRTNQIPRQIPEQSFFTKPLPGIVMGGILPFGCIFIQLFFILNSIWSHQMYYMFGFLFLVFLILLITCSEATILLCYFHLCAESIEHPVRTNQIPRQIPEQSFFTKPLPGIVMGGILPFGCIFIQLFFILNSIWSHQMYYMFGFLFLVFLILLITCSEATILLCYFHLCAEDYHWWWRSFLTSGFTAVYLFVYAVHYFFSKLQITGAASTILYFGYTMIMVLIFFLFTGKILQ
ncbi:UNVERIFIED_CONTAM: hypothetical protein FKN15_055513 [Acipenser sinensis]